ncbi:DUF7948 domain-containing protein [Brumimicrobium aurantiacum]|uniref:PKD domain-containing protein n=1 Tax=Brumimicrobium aurantiacum TaxID=1737063 RepID=A0A3E1EXQ5_9FLAO|nr:gliding motility-associated C-terminal domain-containing protein [Brumimicrobium aurantiacum]RFC54345.1 hypothetical protein DXU93_07925 [Brumimicrobium aurantiacum]
MTRIILFCIVFISVFSNALGQDGETWFEPNRGQWDAKILYRVNLQKGDFFIEKDKFTYALNNLGDVYHAAHHGDSIDKIQSHTVHSHFVNSSWKGKVNEKDTSSFYSNYFLGNDSTNWHSKVRSFKKLEMLDFYPGIDLILEMTSENIKYSFHVEPGVDPSIIQIRHEGMDKLSVSDEKVEIFTRFGPIIEDGLKVWTKSESRFQSPVKSVFKRSEDVVTFDFPEGYDTTSTLIIDPSLTFSTFTGSNADNWGFTAAPDGNANLYAGGIVFGTGYPLSTGAYDETFNGGYGLFKIDIGITKFSSDGTSLLYSTYIGGDGNETPNSIVTNAQGELYILGSTTSSNFPLSSNAYQTTHNSGTLTSQIAIDFNGTDLIVAHLSSDGSNLIASTLLGGSENDGLNVGALNYNYGDVFRGEIILDLNGDVLITSSTQSPDFPIVNGFSSTIGGGQDAIVAKLSPGLNNLIWSTYLGGTAIDAGYSLQVSSTNNIYVSGGTNSPDMPVQNGFSNSIQGGIDGYIFELDGITSNVLSGTYIGTNDYDQSFFVQLDQMDRVYVFGQSEGNMTVTPGVYSNPNSGQFIQQYSTDLSTLNWSTIVGGGNNTVEISPTAFLVSNCNEIYYTGWGGVTNQSGQATGSTSQGFPTTANAYQTTTNGSNFYIGVLSENAQGLNYGTFMGGVASSSNHVDGGTSRFDKQGRIYHAVCGACGGDANGFTTTPGAYSETNNSSNCNLAAWKFDLGAMYSSTSVPDVLYCENDSVYFANNSQNGDTYFWDFGDGSTSNVDTPVHMYDSAGVFEVMFVVMDSDGCFESDTSYLTIEIGGFEGAVTQPTDKICPGDDFQLEASGGSNYIWSPAQFLDDETLPNPTATIDTTTTFTVIVSDSCGADTLTVTLETFVDSASSIVDLETCIGDTVAIWASGGVDYTWTSNEPSSMIGPATNDTLWISPTVNATYDVEMITADGCTLTEQVNVTVFQGPPQPVVQDTAFLCEGDVLNLSVSPAPTINWSPNVDINTVTGQNVIISTTVDRWYYVEFVNPCGSTLDSVYIEVIETTPEAGNDTIVCPGEQVFLWASGGVGYHWEPAALVSSPNSSVTTASPNNPTTFTVTVTDEYGCTAKADVEISHFPAPNVQTNPDYYGFIGDEVQLSAQGSGVGGSYTWSPPSYLSCVDCQDPIATPTESIVYNVLYEDENGCKATDEVEIHYEGIIYVPNSFTPDGDGFNDGFFVVAGNIDDFHLLIFDRWGEVIFESFDIDGVWDGTYGGEICKDGTYIWKIMYEDSENVKKELTGHVNLLR